MKRLTQWYDDGKIRGVLVKDGYEENALQTIVTKIDKCYAAVALLKEYEDTGLTPEEILELKERDTEYFCKTSIFDYESVVCKCGNDIEKDSGFNFCPYCGNRIKLEE